MLTIKSLQPCVTIQGQLLEGPFYDEDHHECRFIDIVGKKLHTFDLRQGSKSLRTIETQDNIG